MSAQLPGTALGLCIAAPLRALRRAILRWRIRWAKEELAMCDHYIQLEPLRRRWLAKQVEALEVDLICLGGLVREP
jgi:hypothetical protein